MAAAEDFQQPDTVSLLREQGFTRLRPAQMAASLPVPAAALAEFAESWNRLETDRFMADGGRYRRRRHTSFNALPGRPALRNLHRPHFQATVHNSLNGGLDRWFAPVEDAIAHGPALEALLAFGTGVVNDLRPATPWFIEMHQFRIEAAAGFPGYPTPEGVHHDGVDFVMIAMIARTNLAGGETVITNDAGDELARFTLDGLLDTAFVDDARVMHGVSPVKPADATRPSCRDVLVLTWKGL
ncbi:2OG-Fe dioxygenase family protein [Rhodovarius lipocyclicus]|uniref:2OG-Fe dioxygenase family protein n=1 Tax=Rhodovarius lipocyclicus TaxID=268410 RepID=UPI0013581590|nr:2OG-Fe dioxygenase family protein [Rhodovarius lipocyclicus]